MQRIQKTNLNFFNLFFNQINFIELLVIEKPKLLDSLKLFQ